MTTSNGNQPGNQKHAPGVLCIIRSAEPDVARLNNDKVVELIKIRPNGSTYQCVCGTLFEINGNSQAVWLVKGHLLSTCGILEGMPVTSDCYLQSSLIPISAPGLSDELLKEDLQPTVLDKVLEELASGSLPY